MLNLFGKRSTAQRRLCRTLWIVYLVVAIFLTVASYPTVGRYFLLSSTDDDDKGYRHQQHPIEALIAQKRAHFESLKARQSKTLTEATKEYQRRYGRAPPLGFDFWFELAQKHNFVLVDEFDTVMRSIEPYYGVPIDVLHQRMKAVLGKTDDRITPLVIQDGKASLVGMLFFDESLLPERAWLEQIPYNMTVLLNSFDEAMVSAPWDEVQQAVLGMPDKQRCAKHSHLNVKPLVDTSGQDGWSATSQGCPPNSPSRQLECLPSKHPHFINNATASKDICQNCDLLSQHGVLLNPTTMQLAHDLVPIWSASKPSHFNDILIPSPYYPAVRNDYDIKEDIGWSQKKDQFYWAGSTTGGRAALQTWNKMQRQRVVLATNKDSSANPVHVLEADGNGDWVAQTTTMAETTKFFDTKITQIVQCEEKACDAQAKAFGLRDKDDKAKEPRSKGYTYKFVLDIDGNAFSGRFYRLLQSKSVVVKQTIFQEWHDDRLIPWVHYVPLSTGYEELPELARYLAGTHRGLRLSERIAKESTEWHNKALRDVDILLVTYRMLLEYGRLMNPTC